MSDSADICQLYKYDKESYLSSHDTPQHFASSFVAEEIFDDKVSWLNYHSIECKTEISALMRNLKVDKLVVEDIYEDKLRPKIEEYNGYVFFSVRSALPSKHSGMLHQEQISFVLAKNYLISLQERKSDHFTEVRSRIVTNKGKIRSKGTDFLLWRMLEAIVENYYEVLEDITKRTEYLEKMVLKSTHADVLKQIESEKKRLMELRKIVLPMKDITTQIDQSQHEIFIKENYYYFSDLRAYTQGVLEEIDSTKQLLDGLTNLYYAVQGQKMNEIMKVLTVVSAVFIPLTFIAGLYGMNFDNIPELHHKNGYFYTLGAMVLIGLVLLTIFYKRGWLSKK
ncbi:MAG: magnesium transporter [Lentimonas sp.]|jgi:magnesium transporter